MKNQTMIKPSRYDCLENFKLWYILYSDQSEGPVYNTSTHWTNQHGAYKLRSKKMAANNVG
jgi:hypothetical protein